jgi:cytochrome c biogenesis protein CcdA
MTLFGVWRLAASTAKRLKDSAHALSVYSIGLSICYLLSVMRFARFAARSCMHN